MIGLSFLSTILCLSVSQVFCQLSHVQCVMCVILSDNCTYALVFRVFFNDFEIQFKKLKSSLLNGKIPDGQITQRKKDGLIYW